MPVPMNVTRIRIDRKTGKEITRETIGTREMSDNDFAKGCTSLFTGMNIDDFLVQARESVAAGGRE